MKRHLSDLLAACLLPMLAWAGCATAPKVNFRPPTLETAQPRIRKTYLLQAGDLVSIKFYYNPELNEDLVIRPDGRISLQLVGDVEAAGRSPEALAAALKRRYAQELATPNVSVILRKFGARQVYVSGEVTKPGAIPLTGGLTLYQAIQESGGLLDSAQRKQVILIRRRSDGSAAGVPVDIRPIESGEHPEQDVPLHPLDMVYVPKSKIANVNVFVAQYVLKNIPPIPFAIAP
ncbi:MAG: polysaccharide biosynthesis/export family protein [Candidatus Binatia bacterium]